MKILFHYCFLTLVLISFTAYTTLNGAERCALIGQVHEGTNIGKSTHVSSDGGAIYSYSVPSYNPICKIPKTEEEKNTVEQMLPTAKEKQKKRNTEWMVYYSSLIFSAILVLFIVRQSHD